MRASDGSVRPHWRVLEGALNSFGPGEMWRRWEQARQLIRQHGVTFNVYGDPRGLERPWPLDPVPVLLSADEFASLTEGLAQRASLLDRLLADLYGPRRTIAEGGVPPEGFLAPPHPLLPRAAAARGAAGAARAPVSPPLAPPAGARRRAGGAARGGPPPPPRAPAGA